MRCDLSRYELLDAPSLGAVLAILDESHGAVRPLAGGTDQMVLLASGKLPEGRYVNVRGLAELSGIDVSEHAVTLGTLTTYTEIQANEVLRAEFPALVSAAAQTGGWAIQNRGTLGGNIANASPAGDSLPVLLAYGAEVELVSSAGRRTVSYDTFHTGYKQTVMRPVELIARVRLPRVRNARVHYFRKVGPREAQAISKVSLAACADFDGAVLTHMCIAAGGVAPVPQRCVKTEDALRAAWPSSDAVTRARQVLEAEIAPIDDVRASARFRRRVAGNLLVELCARMRAR